MGMRERIEFHLGDLGVRYVEGKGLDGLEGRPTDERLFLSTLGHRLIVSRAPLPVTGCYVFPCAFYFLVLFDMDVRMLNGTIRALYTLYLPVTYKILHGASKCQSCSSVRDRVGALSRFAPGLVFYQLGEKNVRTKT